METWKTAEGDEIPLKEMTDAHLRNAHRFVDRRLQENAFKDEVVNDVLEVEGVYLDESSAQLSSECDRLRALASMDRAWVDRFEREAARRGLELKS